jgi:hypothetical protein
VSKPLKILGTVAGIVAGVALIGTGIGAALGGTMILSGIGTASAIASVAGAISAVAGMAAQAFAPSSKPPPARGTVTQLIVEANAPQPYVMGEGYFAGVLRHRSGYGGTVDEVENPYLFDVVVYSGGGPVESISPRVDFATVPAWYSGYLATDTQLGACPEAAALTASYGTPGGWGASYKLSGQAAIAWNFKFDKTGKKFASGLPLTGAYIEGVKVYDPRLDSTRTGGSGTHRVDDEDTWEYSDNPALHAGTYAYGRTQNGKRTLGIGLPDDAIDWDTIAAWANVCDANGWTIFGVAYEPADKWQNLKDICFAGSAEPIPGPVLSFRYDAPAVSLDTITEADIADEPMSVVAMQSYRDRINVVKPKRRSADHNWELVQDEAVSVSEYITEDGEERPVEWPFNFVKDKDQAAQLAAYKLVNARELHPIELVCMPRLRAYRPGDCLHLDLPQLGLDTDAIILRRSIDPATMKVSLTLIGETAAKHAYALGLTGTAPATPALGQTAEERDETLGQNILTTQTLMTQIRAAGPQNPRDTTDAPRELLIAGTLPGGTAKIAVARHDWDYPDDGAAPIVREYDEILLEDDGTTPLSPGARYYIYFDDATLTDTSPTYQATADDTMAINSNANPARHPVGFVDVPLPGDPDKTAGRTIGYGFFT